MSLKAKIKRHLFLDKQVEDYYLKFWSKYPGYAKENTLKTVGYIMRLNKAQHNQVSLGAVKLPIGVERYAKSEIVAYDTIRYFCEKKDRRTVEELIGILEKYDVISFDIFDTVLYREVEFPNDVFDIMAVEIGHNDFQNIRKRAENEARELKEKTVGTREVVLSEIYDILSEKYHIDSSWQQREIELEIELSTPNTYMYSVYSSLLSMGKTIIFTSDMYLPKVVIKQLLSKNGYDNYFKLYLSNEYNLRKGDGSLQKVVMQDFEGKRIIHIGDSLKSDVEKSIEVGLDAVHNPASNLSYREADMDNLAGSFYRSIISNNLNNGLWNENLYFEHGFRVGGILTVGFCEYINKIAKERNVDKVLFCARDCEIVWKVYNAYFKQYENAYIDISRYSIMSVTSDRFLYDLANRSIFRYAEQVKSSKTIEAVLIESGYDYLVDYLEDDDIDKYLFPAAIDKKKLEKFIFNHADIIAKYNEKSVAAAKQYYNEMIGEAKNILVVDIGWTGTCITALKYFLEKNFSEKELHVHGVLMCTSRNKQVTNDILSGEIDAYVYSPVRNMDLTRYMMPAKVPAREQDLLHMPLEFMYTSTNRSLVRYVLDDEGMYSFERTGYIPDNAFEIEEMQKGIIYFAEKWLSVTSPYKNYFTISPYTAFNPLREAIKHQEYCYAVYKNFTYDAFSAPFVEDGHTEKFGDLFPDSIKNKDKEICVENIGQKRILFVTPELTYTGTPRSMLRMCKVAKQLGYQPIVWSTKHGPFIQEFEGNDIEVQIVPEKNVFAQSTVDAIKTFDMAVCNTIVTDKYARICSYYIPTVWYIREATNIPDFVRNNPERLFTLKYSKNIYCVSDYAAAAIQKYTKNKINVVHNCVEDEVDMAIPYIAGSGEKIRFVQFGTMEYRKGYDVLLAAYLAMPKEYQDKSELYFAGGFINSGTPYCDYLFSEMKGIDHVHYLGVVKGEKNKIETLSQMDVVVVASRDESCSLVALEGAMLSKPLIVTENVGAKYMVHDDNGIITNTGDVESLKTALMTMIDNKTGLQEMGAASRKYYVELASMDAYTRDMQLMFSQVEQKGTIQFKFKGIWSKLQNNQYRRKRLWEKEKKRGQKKKNYTAEVIVSLTSHPGRISKVHQCVNSLLQQTVMPKKILLWLSKQQFKQMDKELPIELLQLVQKYKNIFEIRWVDEDLAPHKKYFYTMQEYTEVPVIIVDDDVLYDATLVEKLMESYKRYPDCISCMRANLMMFKPNGEFRSYYGWLQGYRILLDQPSYQLLPTGVGGVLYPPKSLPVQAFDMDAIKATCLYCDDLWLKVMTAHNGYRVVVPKNWTGYEEIAGTQEVALWRKNVDRDNNDISLEKIFKHYDDTIDNATNLVEVIRKDRFC